MTEGTLQQDGLTAAALAERIGGRVDGDGAVPIIGLAGLREAGPGDLAFLADSRYIGVMARTRAAAVLVSPDWSGSAPCTLIRVDNPARVFAGLVEAMAPPPVTVAPGVHPTAVIAADAVLGEAVSVGPFCVVGTGATIGARTVLYPHCVVADGVVVGADTVLHAHVSVRERCRIGDRVMIHDGSVIGSDGFGYDPLPDGRWKKIPQRGIVDIGDDVEIGAQVAIDRARFGRTVIADGVKLDNLIQVAHNCVIGAHTAIAAQVGLAGSTVIGRYARLGGQAASVGHVSMGDHAVLGGKSTIVKDIPDGEFYMGRAAMPHKAFKRMHAATLRLPDTARTVKQLEKEVATLKARLARHGVAE